MNEIKKKILEIVKDDIEKIEIALERNLSPHMELVKEIAGHIIFSGGKRLRPLLMLLSSRICGYDGEDLYDYSVIFEYLHSATLLHDDVIDEAELRRGKKAAHLIHGAAETVLTGDFLLAKSLNLSSSLRNPDIVDEVSKITEEMSQGEIHQLINKGNVNITEDIYFDVIRKKTAVLMVGACRTGARIAGADENIVEKLGSYGYHLGMAFQMADDLLDYLSDSVSLGKNPYADLKEGKLTLPLIHASSKAEEDEKSVIALEIGKAVNGEEPDYESLVGLVKKYGGIEYTMTKASYHVEEAKKVVTELGESRHGEILGMLAEYSFSRSN